MTAYCASTIIRQHGEVFACFEDYCAEDPNIFRHHEMFDFLRETLADRMLWRSGRGKRLDFGKYTPKQVAEMMIDGNGVVKQLGIDGDMPVYMRILPLMKKGRMPKEAALMIIKKYQIQAVVSHQDPLFIQRQSMLDQKAGKRLVVYSDTKNQTGCMKFFRS